MKRNTLCLYKLCAQYNNNKLSDNVHWLGSIKPYTCGGCTSDSITAHFLPLG